MRNDLLCVNLYTQIEYDWINKYKHCIKKGPYGEYYVLTIKPEEKKDLLLKIHKNQLKYKIYEKKWTRSSDYRQKFINSTKEPYKCRYCNKPLKKEYMTIDHIYPVSKGQNNIDSRMLLYIRNISDINDLRNLAPACYKCNKKKGNKLGLWYIRGILGKYTLYWKIIKIFKCISLVMIGIITFLFIYKTLI